MPKKQRMKSLEEISAIARPIIWEAADILKSYYRGDNLNIQEKKEGPVTAADLAVNRHILDKLSASLDSPDFGYLSEETYKSKSAAIDKPYIWIIDPLDGTRDFIEKTGEYAIHLALIENNRPILAIVAVPESEKIYHAIKNKGTFVETRDRISTPITVSLRNQIEELSVVVSRTHRDERFNQLLQQLSFQKQHYVGSVGCKISTIVEQKADVYISLSGKSAPKDWDMAAPELILTEAGGKFTHANGNPLQYNTGDVSQWGCLIASNGHCHELLCSQTEKILQQIDQTNS